MGMIMMNKNDGTDTNEKYVLTNKIFINTMLEPEDVTKIMRVFNWWLDKKCDRYAPIWEKERLWEEWLESPFDQKAWVNAGIPRALPGSIPKGYCKSVKRFTNPMKEAKAKYSKKGPKGSNDSTSEGMFKCEMNANYKPSPTKM